MVIFISGWDISSLNLAKAMGRAKVLDYSLQEQLRPYMENIKPRPSVYFPEFIAANQSDRADNVLSGTKQELLTKIRQDIRNFKATSGVDKVIILWTANTERYSELIPEVNGNAENLLNSIKADESEISPSTLFAVASILEGVMFLAHSLSSPLL
jgi:myo-inositol-1-phosphate synthase